jgi:4,5-DOPA dioxygenase extradiol
MRRPGRRDLLKSILGAAAWGPLSALAEPRNDAAPGDRLMPADKPARMPALFVGHGSPMIAIDDSRFARALDELGRALPRPRAVLSVSAHWYLAGTHTTSAARPETIHDFGGFPEPLYRVQYPAPGDPSLASRVAALLAARGATPSDAWGLDHGTWSVLVHLFPAADVPVVQLSLDARLPPEVHLALGRALRPLRQEGILVMGSGNLTHNLRHAFSAMRGGETGTPAWASAFDADAARALEQRDSRWLCGALESADGRRAHPTPDHYLPLLYAVGASDEADPVAFPITGFDLGSLSMRAVRLG